MTLGEAKVLVADFAPLDVECLKYRRVTAEVLTRALYGLDGAMLTGVHPRANRASVQHERILLAEAINEFLEAGLVLLDAEHAHEAEDIT